MTRLNARDYAARRAVLLASVALMVMLCMFLAACGGGDEPLDGHQTAQPVCNRNDGPCPEVV